MKKIIKKIAIILILVILANNFSNCTIMLPIMTESSGGSEALVYRGLGILMDFIIIIGILALSGWFVEAPNEAENGIYLVHAEYNPYTEYNSFSEKLNLLPENERNSFIKKINSLPEEKCSSLVRVIAYLSASEIASSKEKINALSDAEFASVVQKFTLLTEVELDLIIDKLNKQVISHSEINTVVILDYNLVNAYLSFR